MTEENSGELGNVTSIDTLRGRAETTDTNKKKNIPMLFRDQPYVQSNYDKACAQVNGDHFMVVTDDGQKKPSSQSSISNDLARLLTGVLGTDEHGYFYIYYHSWILLTSYEAEVAITHMVRLGTRYDGHFSHALITSVIKLLSSHPLLSIKPAPREYMVFQNGVGINTKTGETYTPTPECAPMSQLPYDYDGSTSSTKKDFPTIHWFLGFAIGDDRTVELMYSYMAALLKGLRLQYILILKGRGGTGKSAIARLLAKLVGEQNTFSTDFQGLEHKHTIGFLFRKLLLIMSDLEPQHRNKSFATLKRVTGGDPLVRDVKNGAIHNFTFEGQSVITCNEDGIGGRADSGLARRMLIIPIDRVAGDKQREAYPNLEDDMASQIPKLITFLIEMDDDHIRATLRKGTAVMNAARDAEIQGGNALVEFIVEFTVPGSIDDFLFVGKIEVVEGVPGGNQHDSNKKISTPLEYRNAAEHLFPAYLTYCHAEGIKNPLNANAFSNEFIKTANLMDGYHCRKDKDVKSRRVIVRGMQLRNEVLTGFEGF